MTVVERLCKKIERDIGIKCVPCTFRRTYAGYWQRRAGGFAWEMSVKGLSYEIGSTQSVTELVKSNCKLELQGNEIFGEVIDYKCKV
jgi:hypothetical protein